MSFIKIDWQVIKDLKFEIIAWSLVHFSLFNLFVLLPISADKYKEIFMGMNVTPPWFTGVILSYSDLIITWKIILVPVILCILLVMWIFGINFMQNLMGSIIDKKGDKYIQLQFKILAGITVIYLMAGIVNSFLSSALTTPMLKMVNAI